MYNLAWLISLHIAINFVWSEPSLSIWRIIETFGYWVFFSRLNSKQIFQLFLGRFYFQGLIQIKKIQNGQAITAYIHSTVKPALSSHSKRKPKIAFQEGLLLNSGQKYCRAFCNISTFIKLPFVFKTIFCIFLSGILRQVLLYYSKPMWSKNSSSLTCITHRYCW